jgi:hypothetical protein
MGAHLHTKAADVPMPLDADKPSPATGGTAEDGGASAAVDFASTLQDLMGSDSQKPWPSFESAVATDPSFPAAARERGATPARSIGDSARLVARVWTPIPVGGAIHTAEETHPDAESAQPIQAYQSDLHHSELSVTTASSTAKRSERAEQSTSANSQANRAATIRSSAPLPASVDSGTGSWHPSLHNREPASNQGIQHVTGSDLGSTGAAASWFKSTDAVRPGTTLADSSLAFEVTVAGQDYPKHQDAFPQARYKSASLELSNVATEVDRSKALSQRSGATVAVPDVLPAVVATRIEITQTTVLRHLESTDAFSNRTVAAKHSSARSATQRLNSSPILDARPASDLTSVAAENNVIRIDDTARPELNRSSQSRRSMSFKKASSDQNTHGEELNQIRLPVDLKVGVASPQPISSDASATATNPIGKRPTAYTTSKVIDQKQLVQVVAHSVLEISHSERITESNLTGGAAKLRSVSDLVPNRPVTPVVSPGVTHLNADPIASEVTVRSPSPSQLLHPSGSPVHPATGASRQPETLSSSDLRFNTRDKKSLTLRPTPTDPKSTSALRPISPEYAGFDKITTSAANGRTNLAESVATHDSVQHDSPTFASPYDNGLIASIARSPARLSGTVGGLSVAESAPTATSGHETLPDALTLDGARKATETDLPLKQIARAEIQRIPLQLRVVSLLSSGTTAPSSGATAPNGGLATLPNAEHSPLPVKSTSSAEGAHSNTTYDHSLTSAIDAHVATIREEQQAPNNVTATNEGAASDERSFEANYSQPVSAVLEINRTSSTTAEAGSLRNRPLMTADTNDLSPASLRPSSTPTGMDSLRETVNKPSDVGSRPPTKTHALDLVATADGVFRAPDAPSPEKGAEAALVRSIHEVDQGTDSGRIANLIVQLANGQTLHATVRERAGSIDVKIVTPTSASAQRVSGEIDTLRQNLDVAGLRLGHSEISYQQGNGGGRGGEEHQRATQPDRPTEKHETFTLSEAIE